MIFDTNDISQLAEIIVRLNGDLRLRKDSALLQKPQYSKGFGMMRVGLGEIIASVAAPA